MAYRGHLVRFALIGAIGEACGEAPRVSFSGTPPFSLGWLSLSFFWEPFSFVGVFRGVHVSTAFAY